MNTALWIVQGLLAAVFMMVGVMKLMRTKEQMVEMMAWVEDFSQSQIRLIGVAEILGAIGLILPAVTGILPWLTGLAAVGLMLVMLGAAATHIRRSEQQMMIGNAVLFLLALFVAYGRFIAEPFA